LGRDGFRFFARQARNGFVGGQNCFFAGARRLPKGSQLLLRGRLEYAQHDRADKGDCEIRGDNAQSPHKWTGENHGKAPWFTSLPASTSKIAIGSSRKKSALLSLHAISIAARTASVVKES
jgi:hypothetical protein